MSLFCDFELSEKLTIVKSYHLELPCEFCPEESTRVFKKQNLHLHKNAHIRIWIKHYQSREPAKIAKIGLKYFSSADACNAWWGGLDPDYREELRQIKYVTRNRIAKQLVSASLSENECATVLVDLLFQHSVS